MVLTAIATIDCPPRPPYLSVNAPSISHRLSPRPYLIGRRISAIGAVQRNSIASSVVYSRTRALPRLTFLYGYMSIAFDEVYPSRFPPTPIWPFT